MELSIFLLRFFGFYFVIVGVAYILNHKYLKKAMQDLIKHSGVLIFSGVLNLLLGLALVINYNVWQFSAEGFITFLGYLILAKGVLHLLFPQQAIKIANHMMKLKTLQPIGIGSMLVGIWLLIRGFM